MSAAPTSVVLTDQNDGRRPGRSGAAGYVGLELLPLWKPSTGTQAAVSPPALRLA